mmetsp:Transcript_18433/g.29984  ORF Transcript_18433/g.29984 Transcript_18433/m.29984 type:complete len:165 (-) Transcript_18433:3665-4159(-)
MTKTLILMRHAKSSWDDITQADHDRPLNDRGRTAASAIGQWLRAREHIPDATVSSSSQRTGETFHRLEFDTPVHFTRTLYHAGAEVMMDILREQQAETILMLGHNPGISDFASRLVRTPPHHPRFADYPTCATCVMRFDAEGWSDIGWREGQPIDFAIPRELIP